MGALVGILALGFAPSVVRADRPEATPSATPPTPAQLRVIVQELDRAQPTGPLAPIATPIDTPPAETTTTTETTTTETVTAPSEAPAEAPAADDGPAWFRHRYVRRVEGVSGAYEGYEDSLQGGGRYAIERNPAELTIHAVYRWLYRGETCDEGDEVRTVTAGLPDRFYRGRTDLDDYDDAHGALATWLWIDPRGAQVGEEVSILERRFHVTGFEAVTLPGGPTLDAIRLEASGTGQRDDAYGTFDTTFHDTYWFDAATGYVLRTAYDEDDTGRYQGRRAALHFHEELRVQAASYAAGTVDADDAELASQHCREGEWRTGNTEGTHGDGQLQGTAICIGAFFVVVGLPALLLFARPRRSAIIDGKPLLLKQARNVLQLPTFGPKVSEHFAPLLRTFADAAMRAGDPVVYAMLDSEPVGLGFVDRETRIGSIFAPHPDVCEQLRRVLAVDEFFTEVKHGELPSVATSRPALADKRSYNVYETYDVVALDPIPASNPHDANVVRRMTPGDRKEVRSLLLEVVGLAGDVWLDAVLATGDVAFVAVREGRIVGFGLVTVAGSLARLHASAVHPDFRGQGIAKELVRARLHAAHALGATRAVAEVATWNVASLEALTSVGFARVGSLYLESARETRIERSFLRR